MSKSESQTDLTQFDAVDEENDSPNWSPMADEEPDTGARHACQNCNRSVTKQFARVFGNNDDEVHGCLECTTYRDLHSGGGA